MMVSVAMAATDGNHRVDGLEAGLQRLLDGLAADDARCFHLDAPAVLRLDGTLSVDGLPERVDDATHDGLADGNVGDAARALDHVTLLDARRIAEHGDADVVLLEVQHQAEDVARELHELAGHRTFETVDTSDTVAAREHGAGLGDQSRSVEVLDLLLDDLGDFVGAELHCRVPTGSRAVGSPAPGDVLAGCRRWCCRQSW
jgi:hypothetical protein